jgi:ferrous iron transport protein A
VAWLNKKTHSSATPEGHCPKAEVCPLSRVRAGTVVCIKELAASADVMARLREMGFCEEQQIKLLRRGGNVICLVCNARLGISEELAKVILVQPLPGRLKAA